MSKSLGKGATKMMGKSGDATKELTDVVVSPACLAVLESGTELL